MRAAVVVTLAATILGCHQPKPMTEMGGECPNDRPIIRKMAWSIRNEPGLWRSNGYVLSRVDGPSVWVANEDYAVKIGPSEGSLTRLREGDRGAVCLYEAFEAWQSSQVLRGAAASSR